MSCLDHGQKGNYQGYGHSGKIRLHRKVFIETNGYTPACVLHTCDNPRCINPEHLIAGTHSDNNKDRAAKKRSAKCVESRRKITQEQANWIKSVYCKKRGNPFSAPNLAKHFKVDPGTIYNILKERSHFENPLPRY